MVLGWTHLVTELSTRGISLGGKDGRCVGLKTLPPSCGDCYKFRGPNLLDSWGPVLGYPYKLPSFITWRVWNVRVPFLQFLKRAGKSYELQRVEECMRTPSTDGGKSKWQPCQAPVYFSRSYVTSVLV
jgi:hypothetical protein